MCFDTTLKKDTFGKSVDDSVFLQVLSEVFLLLVNRLVVWNSTQCFVTHWTGGAALILTDHT